MGIIREPMDYPVDRECTLCGNKATGYWVGSKGSISTCRDCAISLLSKLIADASVCFGLNNNNVDQAIEQTEHLITNVSLHIYKAVVFHLMHIERHQPTS